ncbi:hypothetical protein K438DRAFT_2008597 [Mycena galopus ATCC 62051]|nr:hypothetical protein K438DRAFT_2008597 [Mycena galopus ATCC 62051]
MTELRKRIEELSVAIERQKEILRDLEVRRSDARRDLNVIYDPMARLPLEISSAIFEGCLPEPEPELYEHCYPSPNCDTAPMIFLRVCRLWSAITLATPSLWAVVHFDFRSSDPSPDSRKHFELWLNRTGNHPLGLSLNGDSTDTATAIEQHAHQLRILQLSVRSLYPFVSKQMSFSSLQTLRVYAFDSTTVYLSDCVAILRSAPLLVHCEFPSFDPNGQPAAHLSHTSLRHLRLESHAEFCCAVILRHLTLPALESLRISKFDISKVDFVSFLARSSPPLQSLQLSGDHSNLDDNTYFQYIPCLTDLTFECLHFYSVSLLDRIAVENIPRGLRNLTIHYWFPSEYNKLICLLTNRQLASLRIIFPWEEPARAPNDDDIAALRRFKEDGMDIHVGPEDMNYI